jgi:hypothetical protein
MNTTPRARLIAYYLPQFHPIPENDAWWGAGFTEWTNVGRARPRFWGHVQPRQPGELGYYDLRVPEVRQAQADLARRHGIEGFCYWHYWFGNGRRLLERPFQEVLRSGRPDFPFCLAWANQSWEGKWHGAPGRRLIEQSYPGEVDEAAHFAAVLPAFQDVRYLCVEGRPIVVVYKPDSLPDARRFTAHWRYLAEQAGLPGLYFIGQHSANWEPLPHGFDGAVTSALAQIVTALAARRHRWLWRIVRRILGWPITLPYGEYVRTGLTPLSAAFDDYPSVLPDWDNTPRAQRLGVALTGSTPDQYAALLRKAIAQVDARPAQKRIVFLKSWNEWAEGNYLEPDHRWERAYLEATQRAVYGDDR